MSYIPNTVVYLCAGVPFDSGYSHVRFFKNDVDRLNYLRSKVTLSLGASIYQRAGYTAKVNEIYDRVCNCNYIFYQNTNFSNKNFYGFITDIRYVNEGTTEIDFVIDYFQTWFGDTIVNPSFIERQHVNDDSIGANLVPEGLETGEYVYNSGINANQYNDLATLTPCIVMGVSELLPQSAGEVPARLLDGTYTGLSYYYADIIYKDRITELVDEYAKAGKADAVVTMFMYPKEFLSVDNHVSGSGWITDNQTTVVKGGALKSYTAPLDGYTPKNNKLYTYPYRYIMLYGSGGGAKEYRYEDFRTTEDMFTLFTTLGGSAPIVAVPNNYKHVDIGLQYPCEMNPYPTCSWVNDNYKNWMAQNWRSLTYNTASGVIGGVAGAIGNAATGNIGGAVNSVVGAIDKVIGNIINVEQHEIIPDSARGSIATSQSYFANGQHYFYMLPQCIKREFAEIIDGFFTMYGYKVNKLGMPNFTGRKSWNYVKLSEANLSGKIPVEANNAIKTMLENGVTLWHTDDMLNYELDNSIVEGAKT